MSREAERVLRRLGLAPKRQTAATDAFMSGRHAGCAWARRALNGNLPLDVRHPGELTPETVRYWLRGFAEGVHAESWHPAGNHEQEKMT